MQKYCIYSVILLSKNKLIRRLMSFAAYFSFLIAALLIVWSFISKINILEEKYEEYIIWLSDLELKIASIDNRWLLILVVMLLYFVKTAFPLYPVSIICVATAMVFSIPASFAINCAGMVLLFSVKYVMGTNTGGGNAQKLIRKSQIARSLIESEGRGNPWVLFIFRLIPSFPVNSVSQLYGAMEFPFWKYTVLSLFGYMPKMAFYIIIGKNVSNPFSLKFSLPLMLLAFLSGIAFLGMRTAWDAIDKIKDHNKQGEIHDV